MLYYISQKLELDIMQASELNEAMELAHVYKMKTVVVHPDLIVDAMMQRTRRQGTYQILTPVDWPKGEKVGITKFHSMSIQSLSCDGFEIALSTRSQGETQAETLAITNFIRTHLPQIREVRFVLGCLSKTKSEIDTLCQAIKSIPAPSLLRTDINLKCTQLKANISAHTACVDDIKSIINRPIKLCGNINSAKMVTSCKADKYGVSLKQAQTIIKELKTNQNKSAK